MHTRKEESFFLVLGKEKAGKGEVEFSRQTTDFKMSFWKINFTLISILVYKKKPRKKSRVIDQNVEVIYKIAGICLNFYSRQVI